jgi:predicted Zn-dependent protease
MDPENPNYRINLGNAYRRAGRYKEAIRVFKKCLSLDIDPARVRRELGITYMKMGDYVRAAAYLKGLSGEGMGKDPLVQQMLGKARQEIDSSREPGESVPAGDIWDGYSFRK